MTKRQMIDEIVTLNHTAKPAFLARFNEVDLNEYLEQLLNLRKPSLSGDARQYAKYFGQNTTVFQAPPASTPQQDGSPELQDEQARPELLAVALAPAALEPVTSEVEVQEELAAPVCEQPEEMAAVEVVTSDFGQVLVSTRPEDTLKAEDVREEAIYISEEQAEQDEYVHEEHRPLATCDDQEAQMATVTASSQSQNKDAGDSWLF